MIPVAIRKTHDSYTRNKIKTFSAKLPKLNSNKLFGLAEYGGSTDSSASRKFVLVSGKRDFIP